MSILSFLFYNYISNFIFVNIRLSILLLEFPSYECCHSYNYIRHSIFVNIRLSIILFLELPSYECCHSYNYIRHSIFVNIRLSILFLELPSYECCHSYFVFFSEKVVRKKSMQNWRKKLRQLAKTKIIKWAHLKS